MISSRNIATTPQEQDFNRCHKSPQTPPAWPHNAPKDESLFVSEDESEYHNEHNSEHDSEDDTEWPCICGDGFGTEGGWIRCYKSNCYFKWYHLACVGFEKAPAGRWRWICPQCRARTRKISVAKPDPEKKGIALRVTRKKNQSRWKGWRELPSDEEEEFKRKVEKSWEVHILPGKTRTGAGQDALYSEDESESTENGESPHHQPRTVRPKQIAGKKVSTDPELSLQQSDSDVDIHSVSTPGKNFCLDDPEGLAGAGAISDYEDDLQHEDDSGRSADVQSPPTPGYDFCSEDFEDFLDGNANATNEDSEEGTIDDEAASPTDDDTKSKDWEEVMDVDEILSDTVESTSESDFAFNDPPVRSSRPATPEAASILISIASTTTGEAYPPRSSSPVILTEGDQALVAALRGTWVGQYFA